MAEVLGPVETLRAAAERLRYLTSPEGGAWLCRCKDSTGRWQLDPSGDDSFLLHEAGCDQGAVAVFHGWCRGAGEWAATMHPGVAEPLAALLEEALPYARLPQWNRYPIVGRALWVARVLLGVPDGR